MKEYQSMLQAVNKVVKEDHRMYFLDLSDPVQFLCVAEQFGGQEHIMREYPHFWKLLERTREYHACHGVSREVRKQGNLEELLYVYDMHVARNGKLFGGGTVTLPQQAIQLAVTATLYQNGVCVGHNAAFAFHDTRLDVRCQAENEWQEGEAKTVLHLAMQRPDEDILTAAIVTCTDYELRKDPIQSVDVIHPSTSWNFWPPEPVNGTSGASVNGPVEYVNVCYARSPEHGERCNYYYSQGLSGGEQEVYLDVRGDVLFKAEGGTRKQFDKAGEAMLMVDTPYGAALAKLPGNLDNYIYGIQDGFHFEFPTDWGTVIPGGVLADRAMCFLHCYIQYYIKGDREVKTLHIGSKITPEEENGHWTKIPDIKLNWGCVAKDTKILMADGTERPISEISRGEYIQGGKSGAPVCVKDIISGHETVLWCIQSENGEKLYASDEHPFVTGSGDKRAIELMETDNVLMRDGSYSNMKYRYDWYYGDTVYNLILEKEHYFVANGYVIGDQEVQGDVMRKTMERECSVPKEVKQEIEKMRVQLGKQGQLQDCANKTDESGVCLPQPNSLSK